MFSVSKPTTSFLPTEQSPLPSLKLTEIWSTMESPAHYQVSKAPTSTVRLEHLLESISTRMEQKFQRTRPMRSQQSVFRTLIRTLPPSSSWSPVSSPITSTTRRSSAKIQSPRPLSTSRRSEPALSNGLPPTTIKISMPLTCSFCHAAICSEGTLSFTSTCLVLTVLEIRLARNSARPTRVEL